MQAPHLPFSVFPRLPRPTSRNDAAENAEKRGNGNRKGETSCEHHILSSASFRVFRGPLHANDAAEYAEKRGNWNRKGETSCEHHILSSAAFRVFCGPSHTMLPLNTLKNAEFCTGRAKRHADITPSFQRLSASSAANYTHCCR